MRLALPPELFQTLLKEANVKKMPVAHLIMIKLQDLYKIYN